MEFDLEKVIEMAKGLGFRATVNSEHTGFTFVDEEDGSKTRVTYEQIEKLINSKFDINKAVERQLKMREDL